MIVQQLLLTQHGVSWPVDIRNDFVIAVKTYLIRQIDEATKEAAALLPTMNSHYTIETVFPRHRTRFRWRGREVRVWRLSIKHPLWLGEDGAIYQGYNIDIWDEWEYPQYLLPAPLDLISIEGLERILRTVRSLEPPM